MATLTPLADFQAGYLQLVAAVLDDGRLVSPRGKQTKEIQNAIFTVKDPTKMPTGIGRKLPTKIVATEAIQFLAGVSDLHQLDAASGGNFSRFSDDGEILSGAYGPRIAEQLMNVVQTLTADPNSRQAGVTIWRGDETKTFSKDVPCTLSFVFMIRDGRLDMTATMRSNDVWLGTAIDVPVFCQLLRCMAWALGVEVGTYTHHAVSLHLYESEWQKAEDMLEAWSEGGKIQIGKMPALTDWWDAEDGALPFNNWERVVRTARLIKEANAPLSELTTPGCQWFATHVPPEQFPEFWADGYYRPGAADV